MKERKADPRVLAALAEYVDPLMAGCQFERKSHRSALYKRSIEGGSQFIGVWSERPEYTQQGELLFNPRYYLLFPEIQKLALKMVSGDNFLIGVAQKSAPPIIINEPVQDTQDVGIDKTKCPHWSSGTDEEVPNVIAEIAAFVKAYVVPFLDEANSIKGFLRCYETSDPRLLPLQAHQYVYVAAAYLINGKSEMAKGALEKRLGSPGMRMTYRSAFEYIEKLRRIG